MGIGEEIEIFFAEYRILMEPREVLGFIGVIGDFQTSGWY